MKVHTVYTVYSAQTSTASTSIRRVSVAPLPPEPVVGAVGAQLQTFGHEVAGPQFHLVAEPLAEVVVLAALQAGEDVAILDGRFEDHHAAAHARAEAGANGGGGGVAPSAVPALLPILAVRVMHARPALVLLEEHEHRTSLYYTSRAASLRLATC